MRDPRVALRALGLGLCLGLAALPPAFAQGARLLDVQADEPRAYGYQVGDLVERRVVLHVPDGLRFDDASLPRTGVRGTALELRRLDRRESREDGGTRIALTLRYQVFLAPSTVRTLEMPAMTLRFLGTPRDQDVRVDAWPVTVAPLVPVEVSPRRGLGEMQPDAPVPPIATAGERSRLVVWATLGTLLLAWLAWLQWGLPWWLRHRQPFGRAWGALRGLPAEPDATAWRAACKRVHEALNASAGEVLFERGVGGFVARRPAFAPLAGDIARFLQDSRREFFAGDDGTAPASRDGRWLRAFAQRCREAELGR